MARGLRRTYERLAAAGIHTCRDPRHAAHWFDVPACLSRRAARAAVRARRARTIALARSSRARDRGAGRDAARGLPDRFVDMNDQICATKRCGVVQNGVVVFTDDNHLTASFARSVAPVLGARLDAVLVSVAVTGR